MKEQNLLNSTNSPYFKNVAKKIYRELYTCRCVNARSWEFLSKLLVGINSCILSLVWSDASHCKIVDHLLWNFRQNLSGQIRSSKLSKSRRKVSAGQGPNILVKNIYRVYQYSLKGFQYLVTLNQSIAGTCTCVEYRIIYKWSRALAQRGVKSYQIQL